MPKRLILELRDDVDAAEICDALEQVGEQLVEATSGSIYDTNRLTIGSWAIDNHNVAPAACAHCGEAADLGDETLNRTWQQWECPCCGAWNDRETCDA